MPEDSIEALLQNVFSGSNRSDWKEIAMREVQGKDPLKILSWRGKDEILFLPYYDAGDVANLRSPVAHRRPPSEKISRSSGSWINLPAVTKHDEISANACALDHLINGADGILFDIRNFQNADLGLLLHSIEWPYCFLAFRINSDTWMENSMPGFLNARKIDPASVNGALFWESIPKINDVRFYLDDCRNFKSLGLVISGATPSAEISDALTKGVMTLEAFESHHDQAITSVCFSLAADASLLETVAKIKALRILWAQVVHAYGHNDYNKHELHINVRAESVSDNLYAPHENMLTGAFAAMAAALGGCDSLTVMSAEQPVFFSRWARNVSIILKEESYFTRVSDPAAGSYALDAMVNDISQKAWGIFQKQMEAS